MRIIECDRCKKKEMNQRESGFRLEGWGIISCAGEEYDMCPDCIAQFHGFMEGSTKKEKPEQKKEIDVGKIKALARAGWKQIDIANDIGCSLPTVRKYIKGDEDAEQEG